MSRPNSSEQIDLHADLESKAQRLRDLLSSLGKVAIAYSGGADSSLLLTVARDCLGPGKVLVLHNRTELQKPGEAEEAIARAIRCCFVPERDLLVTDSRPLTRPEIVRNDHLRCYYCKKSLYTNFLKLTADHGYVQLLDGTNFDDLSEPRPGRRAIAELAVLTPLADASFSKHDVRLLSRKLGLTTWNRPSGSCLATRIPHGRSLRKEDLERVANLEEIAERLGFAGCRVKPESDDWTKIRLQIREEHFTSILSIDKRKALCHFLAAQGSHEILLDIRGRV